MASSLNKTRINLNALILPPLNFTYTIITPSDLTLKDLKEPLIKSLGFRCLNLKAVSVSSIKLSGIGALAPAFIALSLALDLVRPGTLLTIIV